MTDYFGKKLIIDNEVKYVGDELDPKDDPEFKMWKNALQSVYQPERLSEKNHIEDILDMVCDSLNTANT